MSIRLYVGNLPTEVDRQALETVFSEYGDAVSVKLITDRKTGKCRGFAFVNVGDEEMADGVIEKFNGYDFNGAVLKLEKALPRVKNDKPAENTDELQSSAESEVESASGEVVEALVPPDQASKSREFEPRGSKRNRSKRAGNEGRTPTSSSSNEPHQPDPRWAQELEQLKQRLLEAQATK
ncbi:MAG: RNA-binding protein [Pseudanabaenaceae cyanobacterium bins.68]|nr:RNA-binding protein [Pseudanabaenaceae cyanobacterium bins.68]